MTLPPIYPILDAATLDRCGISLPAAAEALLAGGARILQIRQKGHWSRAFFDSARETARLARDAGAQLIVNDRADFALLLDAGLHLGQDDLPPADARRVAGPSRIIGYSSHNPEQLAAADSEPVDYIALGPVFSTTSKQNPDPVVGIDAVRRLRALTAKPLVAIGGITLENAADVLRAGADSLALIAALFPPGTTPAPLRARMEEWGRVCYL